MHVHTAQHHEEAAAILGQVDKGVLQARGAGVDGQLQVGGVSIEDLDRRIVDGLELNGIAFAIGAIGHDVQLLGEHAVLQGDGAIGAELHLLLQLHLFLRFLLLLVTLIRPAISLELLVDLLQILILVVEREQVEAALPVDLPLVLDDVAGLQLGAGHVGSLIPVVGGVIGQRAVGPVEHGDVL